MSLLFIPAMKIKNHKKNINSKIRTTKNEPKKKPGLMFKY